MSDRTVVGGPDSHDTLLKAETDWRVLAPVFVVVAIDAMGNGVIPPLLPFYSAYTGASPLIVGAPGVQVAERSLTRAFYTLSLDLPSAIYYVNNTQNWRMVMTQRFTTDVLICGAGAAGLTLAVELARRGVNFRLIEKLPDPFRGSRGKGIQPRTQEVFEDLGIIDRVVASGGIYPPQREYRDDGSYEDTYLFEVSDPTPAEPYQIPLMVPQFLTEAALRERLTELGHRPEFGCELIGFEQDEERVK